MSSNDQSDSGTKSVDFLREFLKHIITLSSGIVALTITFMKDILSFHGHSSTVFLFPLSIALYFTLIFSWICFGFSILFSIISLLFVIYKIDEVTATSRAKKWFNSLLVSRDEDIGNALALAFISFCVGICCLVTFAVLNVSNLWSYDPNANNIGSAKKAVEEAIKALPKGYAHAKVTKVELINSAENKPLENAVWHVTFENVTSSSSESSDKNPSIDSFDFFIDATTSHPVSISSDPIPKTSPPKSTVEPPVTQTPSPIAPTPEPSPTSSPAPESTPLFTPTPATTPSPQKAPIKKKPNKSCKCK